MRKSLDRTTTGGALADTDGNNEQLAALGRIAAGAALVESRMALFAGKLMTGDQLVGQIVTAELSFQVLAHVLGSLGQYRLKDPALLAELGALIARASDLEAKRNTYVHSVWGDNLGAGGRRRLKVTAKRRKGLEWQVEIVPVATLNEVADKLERLADEFDDLLVRVPQF